MGVNFSQFAGLPVPDSAATDDLSYWLTQLADGLDTSVILQATSNADRDSKFYLAPMGAICVVVTATPAVTGVYVKTSAPGTAVWGTVWQPQSALVWTPLNLALNMQTFQSVPSLTIDAANRWVTLKGTLQTISTAALTNGTTLASVPSPYVVDDTIRIPCAMNQVGSSGVAVGYVGISAADNSITMFGINAATMQPQWVDLAGVRFACHIP